MGKPRVRNRIREYRGKLEMTQLDLAVKARMTPAAVSEIESEKKDRVPTLATALRIAQALGTTVDDLFVLEKEGEPT